MYSIIVKKIVYDFYHSNKIPEGIEFHILGNEEIKRISALEKNSIEIYIPNLYNNTKPKKGGLIDARMGVIDIHIDYSTYIFYKIL